MHIDRQEWAQVSTLLDEALDLEPARLEQWLNALSLRQPAVAETVRRLLERRSALDSAEFLEQFPPLEGLAEAEEARATTEFVPGVRVGPYVLEAQIGQGRMGTVWRASGGGGVHRSAVALKLLRSGEYGPALIERFARERDILASLEHSHIARLYDAGLAENGQPYLALEYVAGERLDQYCDARRLTVRERLMLFRQILDAVAFAHGHLVVHRDLKPSNVLVSASGQVRLLDFGIAKLLRQPGAGDPMESAMTMHALTPRYAAPEQVAGTTITVATDVYALGVILYELLTGRSPYRVGRESPGAYELAILESDPVPPSQNFSPQEAQTRATTPQRLRTMLRGDIDTIVLKALKKRPADRYPTADAFQQDIDRFIAGHAVLARPDTLGYRLRKVVARNRVAAAAGVFAFVALTTGLALALVQTHRADAQARVARMEAANAQAVQAFMEDIFKANSVNQPDPLRAQNTTARALLDIGAQKIDGALLDAPAAKLKILSTIAALYDDLNLETREIELSRKRVRLARDRIGPTSAELAAALVDLATVASKESQNKECDASLAEAKRILDALGDFDSETRAKYEIDVANRLYDTHSNQARAHIDEGIRLLRKGPPSLALIDALSLKAAIANHFEDYSAAADAASAAIGLAQSPQLQGRSFLPYSYMELAKARSGKEDIAGAEDSMRHALAVSTSIYGEDDTNTLMAEDALGNLLLGSSRISEALAILEKARDVSLRLAAAGNTSSFPSYAMNRYARALLMSGRFEESLSTVSAVEEMRRNLETRADLRASLLERRADGLLQMGRYADVEQLLDQAERIRKPTGQEGTAQLNTIAVLRSRLMIFRGNTAGARRALALFATRHSTSGGAVSREYLDWLAALGDLDLAEGNADEALAVAKKALALIEASPMRRFETLWEARSSVIAGRAYLMQRRPTEAIPLLTHGADLSRQLYDTRMSPNLADSYVALASGLLDVGERARASQLVKQAAAIFRTHKELGAQFTEPLRHLQVR